MQIEIAQAKARNIMCEHGLWGWHFNLDNAKRRAGYCSHYKKRISMSKPIITLNDEEQFIDTLLHEIAHALVGYEHGHDRVWRAKCREIGAKPNRLGTYNTPKKKWNVSCKSCGKTYDRHRKPRLNTTACGACCNRYNHGQYSEKYIVVYKLNK